MVDDSTIKEVRDRFRAPGKVVVLTGAGVSAESGVPTFRGKEGLWHNYKAEDLATPEAFLRDPALVWQWYAWRRDLIRAVVPNPAHYTLAAMERLLDDFTLITQNVDGLHAIAGSRNILELHGNIWRTRCTLCGRVYEDRERDLSELPYCEYGSCDGLLRPDIVWFGESLNETVINQAYATSQDADTFLVVGTSSVVQPAASLAGVAKQSGAYIIEINIDPTPLTGIVDAILTGPAGKVLPKLVMTK